MTATGRGLPWRVPVVPYESDTSGYRLRSIGPGY